MDSPQDPILAHALVNSKYTPPIELNYQNKFIPDWENPQIDWDLHKLDENGDECVKLYYERVIKPSLNGYKHRKVLSVFGDDFAYSNADISYKYIDKFISVVSERSQRVLGFKINIHYATVNDYFDAVKKVKDISFSNYNSNFVPYIEVLSGRFDHWTGFYSTRIIVKKLIRDMFQDLRAVKVLYALVVKHIQSSFNLKENLNQIVNLYLRNIEETASILLHHDAITWTSPYLTIKDYLKNFHKINSNSIIKLQDFTKYIYLNIIILFLSKNA